MLETKAYWPIVVTDDGIVTEVKAEYSNAKLLIHCNLLPAENVNVVKSGAVFREKARSPIVTTFAGIFRVGIDPATLNALSEIVTSVVGRVRAVSAALFP